MREFLGIGDVVDRPDTSFTHIERNNRVWPPVSVADNARLAVDLRHPAYQILGDQLIEASHNPAADLIGAVNHIGNCRSSSTTVGLEDDIFGQQFDKPAHVAAIGGPKELLEELTVL
jgi:hypothetical protein